MISKSMVSALSNLYNSGEALPIGNGDGCIVPITAKALVRRRLAAVCLKRCPETDRRMLDITLVGIAYIKAGGEK